jgi:cytochrome P450 family 4
MHLWRLEKWNIITFTGRKYALLKLKIILSTILRNFKVYSDIPEDDYRLQADIILKRSDGFMIRLEPRKKNIMAS